MDERAPLLEAMTGEMCRTCLCPVWALGLNCSPGCREHQGARIWPDPKHAGDKLVDRPWPNNGKRYKETGEAPSRFRVGPPAMGMPMWAVLDDKDKNAIALCWHETEAQRIVAALNEVEGA